MNVEYDPDVESTALKRFLAKVALDDGVRCWEWTGAKDLAGYGCFRLAGRSHRPHRVAYEHFVAPIPEGLGLDHFRCDNRGCVNPTHVRPASQRENVLRGKGPSAMNAAKTHCPQGHPYSGDNLYLAPSRWNRQCMECRRSQSRESKARARAR